MASPDPSLRLRARGSATAPAGRFERLVAEPEADGWEAPEARLLRTELREEAPRAALAWNRSPDLPFDRSLNPYRGCEHGCAYCYARPTHAWLGLSPGLDFETRLVARPGLGAALAREFRARGYAPAPIAIGTATDPYQPAEARARIMPEVLRVLGDFGHPASITTRGTLIARDLDLVAGLARRGLMRVGVSITTLDAELSRAMEPRAPAPARRLETVAALAAAGVPVRVMVAPVIPGLTDPEIERILAAARAAGAVAATLIPLRLPGEVSGLFRDWLARTLPERAEKVMARVREMNGGRDHDPRFGRRMRGAGVWADLLRRRFELALAREGLVERPPPLRCDLFRVPDAPGTQLRLF
jgi:DNA repair photolyase